MPISLLSTTPSDIFAAGSEILLKLLDNVIRDPNNPKYRTIRIENKIISEKLLSVSGMMECLLGMGFEKVSGELRLPSNVLIAQLKKHREALNDLLVYTRSQSNDSVPVNAKIEVSPPQPSSSGGTTKKATIDPVLTIRSYRERITFPRVLSSANAFIQQLEVQSDQVMQYEDAGLQAVGRQLVPVDTLSTQAQHKMRQCQKQLKAGTFTGVEPCFRDTLLGELTQWFNTKFFTWVNKLPCPRCAREDTTPTGSTVDDGVRVELYTCCGQTLRFYRYNDVAKLLQSRRGRCGEYANCFTFLCRCLGFEARLVHATFDHVWTEVWSQAQRRWIHVDPSDAVLDAPLMYQHGWKRSVDYVTAFSAHDVQDVTHRYCNDHVGLKQKRTTCSEAELLAAIVLLRQKRQSGCTQKQRYLHAKRAVFELAELLMPKEVTEDELKGRSSGNMSWRASRGEQQCTNQFYVFNASDEERQARQFNVRFSMARNRYERFIMSPGQSDRRLVQTDEGWESCHHLSTNIQHKVERDWKMVYLARSEESDSATISWSFDFKGLSIKSVEMRFGTDTYENGVVDVTVKNGAGSELTITEPGRSLSKFLEGVSRFTVTATLSGGKGDNAWQHTQLFRQKLDAVEYPFELNITFQ